MWMIEAKTSGPNPEYLRYGPVSKRSADSIFESLAGTGEYSTVRSWCLEAERKQKESNDRIAAWINENEDSIVEGRVL